MGNSFILIGTIITCGLFNSCTADLKDSIKGKWISHETILTEGTEKKIDTLRIVNINSDGTYYAIGKGKEFLGTWTLTNKKTDKGQSDLLTVTVDNHSIVYEVLDINDDELVLVESTNRQGTKGTGIRIPFKRVKM
jgi:hypothetical protein